MPASSIQRLRVVLLVALWVWPATVPAGVHRVPSEQPTIQAGIGAASTGDTVLVAPGTYSGAGNRDITYQGKSIVVVSEAGPDVTIVDVQGDFENPRRGFTFDSEEDSSAVLDGFTIVNGFMSTLPSKPGTTRDLTRHPLSGGGITCQGGSPTIRNCVVRSCTSEYTGGGISIELISNATLVNCTIEGCLASIEGGGISIETGSNPTIIDCVVTGNKAKYGGGISCVSPNATIRGCTVSGNSAERGGGFQSLFPASPLVLQTILWGNCAPDPGGEIYVDNGAMLTLQCSVFDSSRVVINGNGEFHDQGDNVYTDPLFCTPGSCGVAPFTGGEYELNPDSPGAQQHSPCGQRIGARAPACATPVTPTTWSGLKSAFR